MSCYLLDVASFLLIMSRMAVAMVALDFAIGPRILWGRLRANIPDFDAQYLELAALFAELLVSESRTRLTDPVIQRVV